MTEPASSGRSASPGLQAGVVLLFLVVLACVGTYLARRNSGPPPQAPPSLAAGEAERAWQHLDGCVAGLMRLQAAVDEYHQRHGSYPSSLAEAMAPSPVPTCPAAGQDTYTASWKVGPDGKTYTVGCSGRWHAALGVPADRPLYTSDQGLVLPVSARRRRAGESSPSLDPQAQQCVVNLKSLETAVQIYAAQNQDQLPTRLSSLLPSVMTSIPTCPAAGRDTYSSTYQETQGIQAFTICCGGRHHQAAGLPANHPTISTLGGLRTGVRGASH